MCGGERSSEAVLWLERLKWSREKRQRSGEAFARRKLRKAALTLVLPVLPDEE
jgi:hypothetical protein